MNRSEVISKCRNLKQFWAPRNRQMKEWYRLIEMVDELKTDKMESFVGNDPRSMYNMVLHMLDTDIPHKIPTDQIDISLVPQAAEIEMFLTLAWRDNQKRYRRRTGKQSLVGDAIALLIATGWYSVFSIVSDDGSRTFVDVWNPAQVYPMWSEVGLAECAHIFTLTAASAKRMILRNGWNIDIRRITHDLPVYDYWWMDESDKVWNAIVLGTDLVKELPTRFRSIPIFVAPVGGLPDLGIITEDKDTWKKEIGQASLATNENIYKSWNRWWSFSMQLLRDTAQPRLFERSTGKTIVKPEDVFKRGAIFRGGPQDSLTYLTPPPIPLEIRSAQLDMEAMMQRGGLPWAMSGGATAGMTAYVMSQIAASANQVIKPFHQAVINMVSDIDNSWLDDIRQTKSRPYGFQMPHDIDASVEVTADYEVKVPGDLIQRATTARMLNPNFELSYIRVLEELFPEIKNPIQERARLQKEEAERHPANAIITLVSYFKKTAEILRRSNDPEGARLYEKAAAVAEATLEMAAPEASRGAVGGRTEGAPRSLTAPPIA